MAKRTIRRDYVGSVSTVEPMKKWWLSDDREIHKHTTGIVGQIYMAQQYRREAMLRNLRLYLNSDIQGLSAWAYSKQQSSIHKDVNRVTYNVIKSCIDTAASKIAKQKPRPIFLTSGGDWGLRRKAEKLTKYIDGAFDQNHAYDIGRQIFTDACIFDLGAIKVYQDRDEKRVGLERVLPFELFVDDNDGLYGAPTQLHQVRFVPRETLIAMYPKAEGELRLASNRLFHEVGVVASASDLVLTVESWHLDQGDGTGKHVIATDTVTLLSEVYECERFPFVFYRWDDRPIGFWGQGIADQLIGIQIELNRTIRTVQRGIRLQAVPRVMVDKSAGINKDDITNDVASIIEYNAGSQPPIFAPSQAFGAEVYNYIDSLFNRAYQIVGISAMSAQSIKPAGLNSGVAIREHHDIETERFSIQAQKWERFYTELAELIIEQTSAMAKAGIDMVVNTADAKFIQSIKFKDVNIDESQYLMRTYPTGILPSEPAGKLATVQELVQAGFVDRADALSLLDFPDLESWFKLNTSPREVVAMILDNMVETGEYFSPEPYMDLRIAQKHGMLTYLKAKQDGVPEERLELIRRFIEDSKSMIEEAQFAAQQQQAYMQAQAQATGQAAQLPQAELMPQQQITQ